MSSRITSYNVCYTKLLRYELAEQCDLMLMIGSSLEVQPACHIPVVAAQQGAALIFVNRDPTPCDALASVRFGESAGETLQQLAERVRKALG